MGHQSHLVAVPLRPIKGKPTILQENTSEEEKKVIEFKPKLITGGRDGGLIPPKSGNWLKDLDEGTLFFVQNRMDRTDFTLGMFMLVGKKGDNDKVICLKHPEMPNLIYVDPLRFCGRYDLHHNEGVIYIPHQEQLSEEDNKGELNGERDRLPGDVAAAAPDLGGHEGKPE